MATKTTIGIGILLLILFSTGAVYVEWANNARIRVDNDKTTFYVPRAEGSRVWVVSGREFNNIFDGATKMNRRTSEITIETVYDENSITITRTTPYIRGPTIIDTYKFDTHVDNIELFPISHTVEVLNGKGYYYKYEVRDLVYDGETFKLDGQQTSQSFGRNMKVDWWDNYRLGWVYKAGSMYIKSEKIKSNYEKFDVRLFDPIESTWCYQETANESHVGDGSCGLEYTGTYEENTWWTGDSSLKMRDGNWSSSTTGVAANTGIMELNYSKPANATHGTKWNYSDAVGHGDNLTFPLQCWNFDTDMLVLKIESNDAAQFCKWYCHNATEWQILRETSGTGGNIYEDGIYWNITTTSSDSSDTGMEDYLVGYWKLDGDAIDSSGYGNDGTVVGSNIKETNKGRFKKGYEFDGSNSNYIEMLADEAYNFTTNQSFTFSTWAKFNDLSTFQGIVSKYNYGSAGRSGIVMTTQSSKRFYVYMADHEWTSKDCYGDILEEDKWYHLVSGWDNDNNTIFLYINGEMQSLTGGGCHLGYYVNHSVIEADKIQIGRWATGYSSYCMNGIIDEVRIYNKSLSQSEILELYNQSKYTTELAIYGSASESVIRPESLIDSWKFDDSFTSEAGIVQSSGGGAPLLSNDGKYGRCYFNRDNVILYYENSRYKLTNSGNMSFFAWINPAGIDTMKSPEIASLYSTINEAYWNFRFVAGATKLAISVRDYQGDTTSCTATTAYNPADKIGKWAHVGVIYNSTNILLYTNGEKVGDCAIDYLDENNFTDIFRMGYGFNVQELNGSIDEVNYWNTSLTQSEILQLYNQSKYSNKITIYSSASETEFDSDSQSLVGHWKFNGDATDEVGGADGVVTGAILTNDGKYGEAYKFDGDLDNVKVEVHDAKTNYSELSFGGWFKKDVKDLGHAWASTFYEGSVDPNLYRTFTLFYSSGNVQMRAFNGSWNQFSTTPALSEDRWYHIMAVYNKDNYVKLYIDGVEKTSDILNVDKFINFKNFYIGGYGSGTGQDKTFFNGTIDEVRMWNRSLSATEIGKLFDKGTISKRWVLHGSPAEI